MNLNDDVNTGLFLHVATVQALNSGPSRAANPRQQAQRDGYDMNSIEGMLAAEEQKAQQEFVARTAAKTRLERAGHADSGPSAEEIARKKK